MFDLKGKMARRAAHPARNPFIDPAGCKRFIEQTRGEFETELERERKASAPVK